MALEWFEGQTFASAQLELQWVLWPPGAVVGEKDAEAEIPDGGAEYGRSRIEVYVIVKDEVEEFVPSQQERACGVNPQQ
jgi:hypothetical protein